MKPLHSWTFRRATGSDAAPPFFDASFTMDMSRGGVAAFLAYRALARPRARRS